MSVPMLLFRKRAMDTDKDGHGDADWNLESTTITFFVNLRIPLSMLLNIAPVGDEEPDH